MSLFFAGCGIQRHLFTGVANGANSPRGLGYKPDLRGACSLETLEGAGGFWLTLWLAGRLWRTVMGRRGLNGKGVLTVNSVCDGTSGKQSLHRSVVTSLPLHDLLCRYTGPTGQGNPAFAEFLRPPVQGYRARHRMHQRRTGPSRF